MTRFGQKDWREASPLNICLIFKDGNDFGPRDELRRHTVVERWHPISRPEDELNLPHMLTRYPRTVPVCFNSFQARLQEGHDNVLGGGTEDGGVATPEIMKLQS